ncbi:MAG: hypothetical protein AB7P69_15850 [Candidatus Binatia bacterium]
MRLLPNLPHLQCFPEHYRSCVALGTRRDEQPLLTGSDIDHAIHHAGDHAIEICYYYG